MTEQQRIWKNARDGLAEAVVSLGFPEELADLLAGQLRSPRAIDRMTSYLHLVHPRSMETIADEMLAICAETEAWREKKESEAAQAGINRWLNSDERWAENED